MTQPYKPQPEQAALLDRAYDLVESVPYKVTARWLFYRLLQEAYFKDKDDYKGKFLPLLSKARKSFYKKWTPETLADDTRITVIRGNGWPSENEFLEAVGRAVCTLDKWQAQDYYVEIWFEAKAMKAQFEHYTDHITLRPFGGDASIYFKWQIAQELAEKFEQYKKPIVILYFGDMDAKGFQIPISAVKDIREWAKVDFEFIRCGLNPGDEVTYNIPENPDKPGTYQWEALSDDAARTLIKGWTEKYISQGLFESTEYFEKHITSKFQNHWAEFIEQENEY
jgi:hypothetical protein